MIERRQTFIHEAGHIVGVWNTNKQEAQFYGRGASQALAAASPRMALRNADNFGYYVVDRASAPILNPSSVNRTIASLPAEVE
jgi:hypothetical protein